MLQVWSLNLWLSSNISVFPFITVISTGIFLSSHLLLSLLLFLPPGEAREKPTGEHRNPLSSIGGNVSPGSQRYKWYSREGRVEKTRNGWGEVCCSSKVRQGGDRHGCHVRRRPSCFSPPLLSTPHTPARVPWLNLKSRHECHYSQGWFWSSNEIVGLPR